MKGILLSMLVAMVLSVPATGGEPTLAQAVASYKKKFDYPSLKVIAKHLKVGMTLAQVEALLGEGDMPVCGQYRWSSDHEEYSKEAERNIVVGLVLEFECNDGVHEGGLESWEMMQIAE